MEASDQHLVRRAKLGDDSAFQTLVRRHDRKVLHLIVQWTTDEHEVQDLYQDIFIRVHRGLRNFRGDAEFATWLYRIAVNTLLSFGRKKRRAEPKRLHDDSDRATDDYIDSVTPLTELVAKDTYQRIRQQVDQLPEKQRMAIVLRYFEGKSLNEMAEALGWPLGTVKNTLFRATERLRLMLRRNGLLQELM